MGRCRIPRRPPTERVRSIGFPRNGDDGRFVLYCMTAQRRGRWNFALQQAAFRAAALSRPLLVVEVLSCGRRWASARQHALVMQAMRENSAHFAARATAYLPLIETQPGQADDILSSLRAEAAAVVADDHPLDSELPRVLRNERAAGEIDFVDGAGLLPVRATDRAFPSAFAFRRCLQTLLPQYLDELPEDDPLDNLQLPPLQLLPAALRRLFAARGLPAEQFGLDFDDPVSKGADRRRHGGGGRSKTAESLHRATTVLIDDCLLHIDRLPIDQTVRPVEALGGYRAAEQRLSEFVGKKLPRYGQLRNEPEAEVVSGLSPYLRYGFISVHQVFSAVAQAEGWSCEKLSKRATGAREGWWGMSASAEAFLDELITWRELGLNFAVHRPGEIDSADSLPDWARATLDEHAGDPRAFVYTMDQFESARTHDRLWNAAQRQLVREGIIHNYLRMLWGKKILEWSASWRDALAVMIELNNKYGIDGCDPNSYTGIFWVLGRYDRPWGPERPIFGKVRYMSSENTARKVHVDGYIARQLDNVGDQS